MLCRELTTFAIDFKERKRTSAILMGRYDTYRVFTLLQVIVFVLTVIDMLSISFLRGLPLILIPWDGYFIFRIRNMKMHNFPVAYFAFFCIFTILQIGAFLYS